MKLRWMNVRDRTERAELPRLSTVPILRRVEGDRRIVCECPAAFGEGRGVALHGAAAFGGTSPRASRRRRTFNFNHCELRGNRIVGNEGLKLLTATDQTVNSASMST